jgi:geranylgeranyl diphosphate synthase, type II
MQRQLPGAPIHPPQRAERPAKEGIPEAKAERDRLLAAVQQYVQAAAPVPPLGIEELQVHSRRVMAIAGVGSEVRNFLAVLINNEVWREPLARVPFERRLLLLPQCLRDADNCRGKMDAVGLVCAGCGRCVIHDLKAEAERLGYVVLVAEGSPVVMGLLQTRQIEAVIGVSCMSVLERVFPYMHAGAVPGLAVPLICDGCRDTAVDLDWVWEAIHLTSQDRTRRLDLEGLRTEVEGYFTPDRLAEVLGPAATETEQIARDWLCRAGKRWRPFLAVCAYKALRDDLSSGMPEDLQKLAVAVECFHKASLIHDDIEDADDVRYAEQTVHRRYGVPVALNVGDLLLGEGYRLIADSGAPSGRLVAMLRAAAEGHRTLCVGQGAELCWARQPRPLTAEEVLEIFRRKTAPAFDVALHLGATCAGAGEDVWEVLSRYSQALGIAYQIRDDLDDFAGGREPSDAEAARPSVLLALASDMAEGQARGKLDEVWRRKTKFSALPPDVRAIFDATGVVGRARELLEAYKQQAVQCLSPLDNANLKGLLRRVVTRIFNDHPALFCCNDYQSGHDRGGPAGRPDAP